MNAVCSKASSFCYIVVDNVSAKGVANRIHTFKTGVTRYDDNTAIHLQTDMWARIND